MSFSVDLFSVADVVRALRSVKLSSKALAMLRAHASAPNRAMSRLELARAVGGARVETCNSVYGRMAGAVARAIDPEITNDKQAPGSGDFVMFFNYAPRRRTERPTQEPDSWVFVMRETLARALDQLDVAPYTSLDPRWQQELTAIYDPELFDREDTPGEPGDPLDPPLSIASSDIDDAEPELAPLDETERDAVIQARLGQGIYRQALMVLWEGRCAVTGVAIPAVLIAAHVKPWRDSTNAERLDRYNGLLLAGTFDRLFDAGLISFQDDGTICISPSIPEGEYDAMGLHDGLRLRHVAPEHRPFLEYHRTRIFVNA